MHNVEELLFRFREHLKALGRSPATIKAYSGHVQDFLQAVGVDDIKALTTAHVTAYIAGLYDYRTAKGAAYSSATICVKVRAVKRLFEYLEGANIIFINPAESIREPPVPKRLPCNVLSAREMARILAQPNLGLMGGIRDRALLEVFYSTGIRRAELCGLSVFDADLTGAMLRIRCGKGGRQRVVPLGKHAVKSLREYITQARPRLTQNNPTTRRLFVNRLGRPLSGQMVAIIIRTYARSAGIGRPVTAHSFRHSFATALVKNGADIRAVQKMLGHVDLRTTQVYIHALGADIKAVHRRTHPREKDRLDRKAAAPAIARCQHASR